MLLFSWPVVCRWWKDFGVSGDELFVTGYLTPNLLLEPQFSVSSHVVFLLNSNPYSSKKCVGKGLNKGNVFEHQEEVIYHLHFCDGNITCHLPTHA